MPRDGGQREGAEPCKKSVQGSLKRSLNVAGKTTEAVEEIRDQQQTGAGGGRVNEMGDGASEAQVKTGWGRRGHDTQKVSQNKAERRSHC